MISRFTTVVSAVVLGATLLAPGALAQGRGARAPAAVPRPRSSFSRRGGVGLDRRTQRRYFDGSSYLWPPYYYSDDEWEDDPDAPPVETVVVQHAPAPAPESAPKPSEPLVLENRNGEWVRIPTGNQISIASSKKADATSAPTARSGFVETTPTVPLVAPLPPAIIVFRDGHTEEIGKYMIEGDTLYTHADHWSTGSWNRKIPLSQLDIPASLLLNKERGTKFKLPAGPSEVVIRF
jgi:hypothetical protein